MVSWEAPQCSLIGVLPGPSARKRNGRRGFAMADVISSLPGLEWRSPTKPPLACKCVEQGDRHRPKATRAVLGEARLRAVISA